MAHFLEFELSAEKAAYYKPDSSLWLADLHLGKSTHFRKAGIAVPNAISNDNLVRLIKLFQWFKPKEVVFLGDLFHSVHNRDWEHFAEVISQFPAISFKLIMGNHDIMSPKAYEKAGIELVGEQMRKGPYLLTHEPMASEEFAVHGHTHPGVRLQGKGLQKERLPCFHFGEKSLALPSFGGFTGLSICKLKKGDKVFAIADGEILEFEAGQKSK